MAMQRVLITGGSRGVGRATALRLAREGVAVAVLARDAKAVDEAVQAVNAAGGRGVAAVADVGDAAAVDRAVHEAIDALGGLDGLVLNAGSTVNGPIETYNVADWNATLATNLTLGEFLLAAALPALHRSPTAISVMCGVAGSPRPDTLRAKWGKRFVANAREVERDLPTIVQPSPGSLLTEFRRGDSVTESPDPFFAILSQTHVRYDLLMRFKPRLPVLRRCKCHGRTRNHLASHGVIVQRTA